MESKNNPVPVTIRDRIKDLRRVRAGDLQKNPKNWRTHPDAQRAALRGVLAEIGYAGALLAREARGGALVLIDGHLRLEEAQPDQLLPVLILDVTAKEADKLLATLDPLGAMAGIDAGKLDELLADIKFDSSALDQMLREVAGTKLPATEVVEDQVPEPPAKPITKPGDLWLLGEHRLLCGDCRIQDDLRRVLNGGKANCIFTDPPYGVSLGAKNRLLNSVDDDLSPEELEAQLLPAITNLRTTVMSDDCTLFVCGPQGGGLGMMMMMMMMQKAGLTARHIIIWVKNQPTFSMGRLDYDYQHEPILLTWLKRHKRPMAGEHRTSVWRIDRERKCDVHPTMKPVALYANAYLNNSESGDIVFDGYSGSGTAFIAAEQTGRRARGVEISPAYCDVIVERWEKLTGGKATRIAPDAVIPKRETKSRKPKKPAARRKRATAKA